MTDGISPLQHTALLGWHTGDTQPRDAHVARLKTQAGRALRDLEGEGPELFRPLYQERLARAMDALRWRDAHRQPGRSVQLERWIL